MRRRVYAQRVPTVSRLCVTPVKGLALQELSEVELTEQGVAGNRRFFVVGASGRLFSGIHHGPLCLVRADYDSGRDWLSLELPNGAVVDGSGAAGDEIVETDFYGDRIVRSRVVEGPFAEALSAYVGKEVRLVRPDRAGDGCDIEPVTLLSEASVEELRRQAGREEPLDGRRFRMLVHLDGCEPHEEDTWEGRLLQLGQASVRVGGPVPRCATTTRSPATGTRDFDTLREIKAYRGLRAGKHADFGVYGTVEQPGRVRVGDGVVLHD
jgi:uncharacterized protein YcbX